MNSAMQRGFFLLVFIICNFHRIFGSLITLDQGGAYDSLTNANPLQGKHLKISGLEVSFNCSCDKKSYQVLLYLQNFLTINEG